MNKIVFLSILLFAGVAIADYEYRSLGQVGFNKPAQVQFLDLQLSAHSSAEKTLVVTSFGPFSGGDVQVLGSLDSAVDNWSAVKFSSIAKSSKLAWPNCVISVPSSIAENSVLVADGFLVPGKSTGGLYVIIGEGGSFSKTIKLTKDKSGWFYHNATFVDLNGDGKLDILTARATKGIFGGTGGELLWLENPGSIDGEWKETVITQGPDVFFSNLELDGDSSTYDIVATQFFSNKVAAYFLSLKDGSLVDSVVIDDSIGAAYDVQVVDLNGDGKPDLMINNHDGNEHKAGIFAYEIPETLNGTWKRHTVASGFKTRAWGVGQASPGFCYAFHPKVGATHERPYILVAGDGAQAAFLLRPNSEPFGYDGEIVVDAKGVVGAIAIADIDNDGYVEFFVPNYDGNAIYGFSFGPSTAQQ